ncbi:MAG: FUSC family protein [Verrucomicrobiota bacterium]
MVAIVVAGAVAVLLHAIMGGEPIVFLVFILAWLCVWMAAVRALPLGHLVGGILITMILFTTALGTAGVMDFVLHFWLQCLIGFVLATIVDRFLWREPREAFFYKTLAELTESFAGDWDEVAGEWGERSEVHERGFELIRIAQLNQRHRDEESNRLELFLSCRLVWNRLRLYAKLMSAGVGGFLSERGASARQRVVCLLAEEYRHLANQILSGEPAEEKHDELEDALAEFCEATVDRSRSITSERSEELLEVATMRRCLTYALVDLARLKRAYNGVRRERNGVSGKEIPWFRLFAAPFRMPGVDAWKVAVKVVMTAFCLLIGVLYLDFPGEGIVAFYAVAFGVTGNLGQLLMRGRVGTVGILAGLLYGVVGILIVEQSPHFVVLTLVFAIGIFLSAYAATGSERFAIGGLQATLVIPFVMVVNEGPQWTVQDGLARTEALIITAIVAYCIQRLVWPADPVVQFRRIAVRALEDLRVSIGSLREGLSAPLRQSNLEVDFGRGASLLHDSQHIVGSQHPVACAYLDLLRALGEMISCSQNLAITLANSSDNPLRAEFLGKLEPIFNEMDEILSLLESFLTGERRAALLRDQEGSLARLSDLLQSALGEETEIEGGVSMEDIRLRYVAFSLADDMVAALGAALESAISLERVGRPARRGNSVGWRSGARTSPVH